MPEKKFLAFDFGAESGRAMLGLLREGRLELRELHRFDNPVTEVLGHLHWDMLYLFRQLKQGLAIAAVECGGELDGIGVDTWGVDFGLMGRNGELLGQPYMYRDGMTEGAMEEVFRLIPKEEMFRLTGNQFMRLNTVFQLFSLVRSGSPLLEAADRLLFMPDLFNYFLTGEQVSEYCIASTSQLLEAGTDRWSRTLAEKLDLPFRILGPVVQPGTRIGGLLPAVAAETGLRRAAVLVPTCHDTACAVAAVPASPGSWAYISSGTWSLIGVELPEPILTSEALEADFTNEGGVEGSIRFLHISMGLWLLQCCRQEWEKGGSVPAYEELIAEAEKSPPFRCLIDPDDPSFLNPESMTGAIRAYCRDKETSAPETKGETVRCILESLALKYRFVLEKIEAIQKKKIEVVHILGGGSQNRLLNQFTADVTRLPLVAGPVEATAAGNILMQARANGDLATLADIRTVVVGSFRLDRFEPKNREGWDEAYERAKELY